MAAYTHGPGGARAVLNLTVPTVVKASAGVLYRVIMVDVPTAAGGIYDTNSLATISPSNRIDIIPGSLGQSADFYLDWPCHVGIVVDPGTNGIVSVSYT